jgi:outer membrane protein assembly factor BamB
MERKQNMSTPSPVTDGRHVWVMTGVGILKAFDFAGKEIWSRDLQKEYGQFGLQWGYASSPLLQGDALYVQVLHGMKTDDPSYILKVDKATGKNVWRVERLTDAVNESPDSYTTPLWVEAGGRTELVITGGDVVSGHDPATGKELWRADVLNPTRNGAYRLLASPLFTGGVIIAPTRNNPLVAVRPGGSGDVANSHILWSFAQWPDVPTPVSDGKLLYIVRDNGVVFALDVQTGATVYGPVRLPPGSPTLPKLPSRCGRDRRHSSTTIDELPARGCRGRRSILELSAHGRPHLPAHDRRDMPTPHLREMVRSLTT